MILSQQPATNHGKISPTFEFVVSVTKIADCESAETYIRHANGSDQTYGSFNKKLET